MPGFPRNQTGHTVPKSRNVTRGRHQRKHHRSLCLLLRRQQEQGRITIRVCPKPRSCLGSSENLSVRLQWRSGCEQAIFLQFSSSIEVSIFSGTKHKISTRPPTQRHQTSTVTLGKTEEFRTPVRRLREEVCCQKLSFQSSRRRTNFQAKSSSLERGERPHFADFLLSRKYSPVITQR